MKTFNQFITEAYDKEMAGQASRAPGEGGRIRASRKKRDLDKTRKKAIGGGKTAPVKDYKPRKDIGTNKPRSRTQQQPEKPRGSAALSPREAQKKAAMERRAAKSGAKTKTADELLAKKAKKTVDPDYKPAKASGLTRAERMKVHRKGETKLRNIFKDQETAKYKKETGADPDKKGKTKILSRVHKRMST